MSFRFKRGSTFAPTITYTPPQGGLANLIGAAITSRLSWKNSHVDLVATLAPNGLSFTLAVPGGSTSAWPTGDVTWDVKVVVGGVTFYTDTTTFAVVAGVTP